MPRKVQQLTCLELASEDAVFTVRVIPLIHLVILLIIAPSESLVLYGVFALGNIPSIIGLIFWTVFFALFLFSVLFSKLYVYPWGLRIRGNFMTFDSVNTLKLSARWKLLVHLKGGNWLVEQNWFLLSKPLWFGRELKRIHPGLPIEYT